MIYEKKMIFYFDIISRCSNALFNIENQGVEEVF